MIKGASWSILRLVLLSAGVAWAGTNLLYAERIATLEAHIEFKDDPIAELQTKASAVPALLERIEKLEERVFAEAISDLPSDGVSIYLGKWADFAKVQVIAGAVNQGGWAVRRFDAVPPAYAHLIADGPIFRPDSEAGVIQLKAAFDEALIPYNEAVTDTGEKALVLNASEWAAPFVPND